MSHSHLLATESQFLSRFKKKVQKNGESVSCDAETVDTIPAMLLTKKKQLANQNASADVDCTHWVGNCFLIFCQKQSGHRFPLQKWCAGICHLPLVICTGFAAANKQNFREISRDWCSNWVLLFLSILFAFLLPCIVFLTYKISCLYRVLAVFCTKVLFV